MAKGQVSIDLMLAVFAVVVFAVLFSVIYSQFSASQKIIEIQSQQKSIGESLAQIIPSTAALKPTATATGQVTYAVPKIFDNTGKEISCNIIFSADNITLSSQIDATTPPIITQVPYVKAISSSISNAACGTTLTINV